MIYTLPKSILVTIILCQTIVFYTGVYSPVEHTKQQRQANQRHEKNVTRCEETNDRLLVTLSSERNIVIAENDTAKQIKLLKIINVRPKPSLDYRIFRTLSIKIEVDGRTKMDSPIIDFIPKRGARRHRHAILNKEFRNFNKLTITIYDSGGGTNFEVEAELMVM